MSIICYWFGTNVSFVSFVRVRESHNHTLTFNKAFNCCTLQYWVQSAAIIKLIVLSVEDCFIIFMFDHVMNHLTFDNTSPGCLSPRGEGCEHVIRHQPSEPSYQVTRDNHSDIERERQWDGVNICDGNALIFNLTSSGVLIQEAISMKVIGLFLVSYLHFSQVSNCACIISEVPFPALLILGLVVMLSFDEIR